MAPTSCARVRTIMRSEEHTSELQSQSNLVCRLLLEKKKHTFRKFSPAIPGVPSPSPCVFLHSWPFSGREASMPLSLIRYMIVAYRGTHATSPLSEH